jgi:aminomethyltransferase
MTDATQLQRTPLWDVHRALGAKMVSYAGFDMPVQYATGILAEHQAVRTNVGLFDISHMGEFEITGPDRNAFLNRMTCNDVTAVEAGGSSRTRAPSWTTARSTASTTNGWWW